MPADHLACNKKKWDSLSAADKDGIRKAMTKAAMNVTKSMEVENEKAVTALKAKGVTLHNFSKEDRAKFREAAMKSWDSWKTKTPEAKLLVDSHVAYMKKINLIK